MSPAARPPTQTEAIARIGRVHATIARFVPPRSAVSRRNGAFADEAVELDSTAGTTAFKQTCAGGGSLTGTTSASTSSTGSTGGSGTVDVSMTFTNCATDSQDTYTGSITFTLTSSAPANVTTATYVYSSGIVAVTGATPGKYDMKGLVVTTATTNAPAGDAGAHDAGAPTGPSVTVLDGATTIDGHAITFIRERVL